MAVIGFMYHTIVIGLGAMGSSALFQLARQGIKVLGLEQFGIVHDRGSHSGHTRIVRKAYFEHPDYVPLLESAYHGWAELEVLRGATIFHKTGLVYFGETDHPVMEGVRESAEEYEIPIEYPISSKEYSMFNMPDSFEGILEPDAGFTLVEPTIRGYVEEAKRYGAEVQTGEAVLGWRIHKGYVEVHTSKMEYHAQKLVLTAGAYLKHLVPSLADKLTVTRQIIGWVKPERPDRFSKHKFPCWVIADKDHPGIFYGFPIADPGETGGNGLLKIAHHAPGSVIDPSELKALVPDDETEKLRKVLADYLPEVEGEIIRTEVCIYTNTPDEHFMVDFLPETEQRVILAAGFSGHGFKFVPIVGEILSDLVLEGRTKQPVDFLRLNRFE